ncbi:putative membrane protein (TIGR01218 family) [Enterococcus rotai]|uniref:Tandem five-TM protein n=1 Tax=Enterococcus rotai TaxID=118060 RepID=A0A0U2VWE3_9ENTE|nr:DUF443 family protein [Enterococcus rotai]ALS37604.1 hypothetical protein ATZ35_10695 [Enterococcus rotai]
MIEKTTNKRYKHFNYKNESILLDMDSNKITWFFPFLVWFLPVKGYRNTPLPSDKTGEKKTKGGIVFSIPILSIILIRLTDGGFGDLSKLSNYREIIMVILFSSMILVYLIRYFWRYKKNNLLMQDKEIVYLKFSFNKGIIGKYEYIYKVFILTIVCYGIVIFFSSYFINDYPNIIILPLILLVEYFLLIINTTIAHPEKDCTFVVTKEKK